MNTNDLAIFVEIIRRGSFAAVARDRNLNPATISRSIASLERELKLRLFQRTTRKIEPTEAGLIYFERVEPLIDELNKAQLSASDAINRPQGILRISCPVSFAELNITPLLPEFSARFPDLRFEFILTDTVLDLIEERLDVAIRIGSLKDSAAITHRLAPMLTHVCAAPQYLEKHGRPKKPEDLSGHQCLLLAMPGFTRNSWKFVDRKGHRREVLVNEFLRTSNAMALKQCALAGMGITLQARWMIGKELCNGSLVDLFPDYETSSAIDEASAWLLYPSRSYVPQKVRVFVDYLKEKFKGGAPWDR